jgi:serine/threonine protein kinase
MDGPSSDEPSWLKCLYAHDWSRDQVTKERLDEGGQGYAYRVRDTQDPDGKEYVAKVLKGNLTEQSPRWKRLEEEIEVSKSFDHPNVVHVIDSGHTGGSGYPYYVMPFYSGRSLREYIPKLRSPLDVFTLFAGICDGVAYIQSRSIVHWDLKPENIFVDAKSGAPIIGDFGLCFRFGAKSLTETKEVVAARWFGAPELRDGHLENPLPSADVYSLGKLLYWLFTGEVYDRDEQEYETHDRKLSQRFLGGEGLNLASNAIEVRDPHYTVRDDRLIHAGAFADEIVSETVRYRPQDRIKYANELCPKVRRVMSRFQAGGRALVLNLPQRCLFCASGMYRPLEPLPPIDKRLAPADPRTLPSERRDPYHFGTSDGGQGSAGPLILICDHCGNVQQFRLDLNLEAVKNWG